MRIAKSFYQFWIFFVLAASMSCTAQQLPPVAVDCFGIGENFCDQVQPNTYFVSTSGSDQNSGQQGAAWRTLNHAVHSVGPGATIIVEDGVYDGFRNFSVSGTDSAPITLKAGGSNVIVNRGLDGNRDIFEINGVQHWVVDGFKIGNGSRSGVAVIDADSITLKNNDIGPNQVWGIFTGFSTNLDILHNRTFGSAEQHGIYVSNSRVANDNVIVRGNMVYGNYQNGIQFNGDCEVGGDGVIGNSVIEANRIYDNGYKGLSLISMSDSRVSNNIIYENGVRGGAGGIHLTDQPGCGNPSSNNEVFNNTIYEPRIAAVRITDAASNNILFNNIAVSGTPFADEVGSNQIDATSNLALGSSSGLFVDFAARNFELADGSAALDGGHSSYNGIDVGQLDYRGAFRPQGGAIDIGAVEGAAGGIVEPPDSGDSGSGTDGGSGDGDSGSGSGGSGDGGSGSGDGGSGDGDSGSGSGGSGSGSGSDGGDITRPPAEPGEYVYLNEAVLAKLRAKLDNSEPAATRFESVVNAEVNGADQYSFPVWAVAMMYPITGEQRYCDFAVAEIDKEVAEEEAIIAAGNAPSVAFDSYLYSGGKIGDVARVYDWCREFVTSAQGTRWMNYANQAVWNIWNHRDAEWGGHSHSWSGWATTNPMNNYHYSFMEATLLAGLVQRETNPQQAQVWMDRFRTGFVEDMMLSEMAAFVGGGSPEGTSYGDAMRELWMLFDIWEQTTGERIHTLTNFPYESMDYSMHAVLPTLDYTAYFGDHARESTSKFFDYNRHYLLVLAELYQGTGLSSMARDLLDNSSLPEMYYSRAYVWDFLYVDHNWETQDYRNMDNFYYAESAGHLFSRTDWEQNSTFLQMSFGPRTESHDHMDKGSFGLYKTDWLAYTQNINSDNGLKADVDWYNLVKFVDSGASIEQPWTDTRATVAAVENTDLYTRVALELAPIYENPDILNNWRELIFIRPGVTVVYDYARTSAGIGKVWQLNSPYWPAVNGNVTTFSAPNSTMRVTTLLPQNPGIGVFNWSGQSGVQSSYEDSSGTRTTGYRLEITSSSSSEAFLNVIDTEGVVELATVATQNGEQVLSLKLVGENMMTFRFQSCCTPAMLEF